MFEKHYQNYLNFLSYLKDKINYPYDHLLYIEKSNNQWKIINNDTIIIYDEDFEENESYLVYNIININGKYLIYEEDNKIIVIVELNNFDIEEPMILILDKSLQNG